MSLPSRCSTRQVVALALAFTLSGTSAYGQEQAEQAKPVVVAVDFSALSPQSADRLDALGLETRILLRLIQEGFAVAAPFTRPEVLVRAEDEADAMRLIVEGAGGSDAVDIPLEGGVRAELQLEVAHRAVDLARLRADAVLAARKGLVKPAEPRALMPLRPTVAEPVVPPPPDPLYVETALGAGALWRGSTVDPLALVRVGLSGIGPLALDLVGGWSGSSAPGLTVSEWQVQAGPRVRIFAAGRWRGESSILVGVMAHTWRFEGPGALESTGAPLDVIATLPLELRYRIGWASFGARFAPGLTGSQRSHRRDGLEIWEQHWGRLEAGLFFQGSF